MRQGILAEGAGQLWHQEAGPVHGPVKGPVGEQTLRRIVTRTAAGPEGTAQSWTPVLSSEAPDRVRTAKDPRCALSYSPQTRSEQSMWEGEEGQCGSEEPLEVDSPESYSPHAHCVLISRIRATSQHLCA